MNLGLFFLSKLLQGSPFCLDISSLLHLRQQDTCGAEPVLGIALIHFVFCFGV